MNNIELITKYATEAWDKVYKKESISSILDGEKDLMKFVGVKTVKIAKHSSDGMGFYQRANKPAVSGDPAYGEPLAAFNSTEAAAGQGYGYPTGDVNLTWEEFTIRIDRARQLRIELFDNEESGELAVTSALTDFSRTKVAPEVDAYVFSTLVKYAGTVEDGNITLSSSMGYNQTGPIQALNDAFTALEEEEVPEEDQIVFASVSFINKLRSTNELVRVLHQNEYKENVNFSVYEYMGRKIVGVPGRRFRTDIVLTQNGFTWGEDSNNIDFIVCAKSAVYHVVKYDKIRVFDPKLVQDFDGYKVNVRVYHDCFVPDNKRVAIYAHVSRGSAPAPTIKFIYNNADSAYAPDTLTSVAVIPGDIMIDGLYAATSAPSIGDTLVSLGTLGTNYFAIGVYTPTGLAGAASTGTDYYVFAARGGKVVAVNSTDKLHVLPNGGAQE